jgi:anionic cell wall polymer biosynthesis LytR-Cps2A-Psr (LCP) family protein
LNGLEALEYVRSRHADLVGDIGRTNRQQEILQALKKKLTVPNIINHFQQLITDLAGKVYTDMSPQEILAFANFGRTLPSSGIQRITLGPGTGNQNYGQLSQVYDSSINADQDVVLPHCENIGPLFSSIFGGFGICNVNGGF